MTPAFDGGADSDGIQKIPQKPPIATLSRGAIAVRMHERFGFAPPAAAVGDDDEESPDRPPSRVVEPRRRTFRNHHDAETFLVSWRSAPGAMGDYRRALARCDRSAMLHRLSDDDVIRALSTALVSGSIVITEGASRVAPEQVLWPDATTAEPPTVPLNPGVDMPLAPALVLDALPEAVLDLLEEVQIEGAQVLPEIWQTLEQIHLTMEKLNLISVSLAPTPSGVPAISAAMSSASDSIAAELAAL